MKAVLFALISLLVLCTSCGAPAQPTDEEVLAEYAKASEAASWFSVCTAPLDYAEMAEVDGMIYHRLRDFESYDAFKAHLDSLFGDQLLEGWFSEEMPMYVNVDGKVFGMDAARGTDIGKGGESYEILRETKKKYILRVTVELLDYSIPEKADAVGAVIGQETHDFLYEYVDEDWVFTEFPEIR